MAIKYNDKGVTTINGNGSTDNVNTYKHGSTVVGKRPMERHFVCNTSAATIRARRTASSEPILSGAGSGDIFEQTSTYDSVPNDHLSDSSTNGARQIFYGDTITFYCTIATTGYYFMSTSTISDGTRVDTTTFSSLTYYINCNNTYPCYITESHGLSTKIGTSGAARQDSGTWFTYGTTLYGGVNVPTSTTSGAFYYPDGHGTGLTGDGYDIGASDTVSPTTQTEGTTGLSFSIAAEVHYHYKVSGSGLPAGSSYCSASSSASSGFSSGSLVDIGTSSSGTVYIYFTATGQTVPKYNNSEGTLISGTKGAPGAKYRLTVSVSGADVSRACSYNTYRQLKFKNTATSTSYNGTTYTANQQVTAYVLNGSDAYLGLISGPKSGDFTRRTKPVSITGTGGDGGSGYDTSGSQDIISKTITSDTNIVISYGETLVTTVPSVTSSYIDVTALRAYFCCQGNSSVSSSNYFIRYYGSDVTNIDDVYYGENQVRSRYQVVTGRAFSSSATGTGTIYGRYGYKDSIGELFIDTGNKTFKFNLPSTKTNPSLFSATVNASQSFIQVKPDMGIVGSGSDMSFGSYGEHSDGYESEYGYYPDSIHPYTIQQMSPQWRSDDYSWTYKTCFNGPGGSDYSVDLNYCWRQIAGVSSTSCVNFIWHDSKYYSYREETTT